jgi:hypothetical protein
MKRGQLISAVLFSIILTSCLVSAIDWSFLKGDAPKNISKETSIIILSKTTYDPREILLAQITKNFIDTLKLENIEIYKEGIPRPQPVVAGLTKHENVYYYYAILPNQEGNFSVLIQNTKYTSLGKETNDPITQDFKVQRSGNSGLKIDPGFFNVLADQTEISMKVMSINGNQNLQATLEATGESKDLSLIEDVEKTLKFSVLNATSGKTSLKIGDYTLPVFILEKKNSTYIENQSFNETDTSNLVVNPSKISGKVISGQDYLFKILLENKGNKTLNVNFSNDLNATIKPKIIDLTPGKQVPVNITIPIGEKQKEKVNGVITAWVEDFSIEIPVEFEITQNKTDVQINGSATQSSNCYNLGTICDYDQECKGEMTSSLQGPCCIGKCEAKSKPVFNIYIGILILIVLVAIGAYFFLKSKKGERPKSAEEILKERSSKFNQRMGTEISGGLGRI